MYPKAKLTKGKVRAIRQPDALFTIYTDGACDDGYGGLGVLVYHNQIDDGIMLQAGFLNTTNNRMEMLGAILALERLYGSKVAGDVLIVSDSQYMINSFTKWRISWKNKGWKRGKNGVVKNLDLVQRFDRLLNIYDRHIDFLWVRGHDGNELNEKADRLAVGARIALRKNKSLALNEESLGTEHHWEKYKAR